LNSNIAFGQSVTPVSDSNRKASKSLLITEKDTKGVFYLKKNGRLTIKLGENPSTGASWQFIKSIDSILFSKKNTSFKTDPNRVPNTPGVGGTRFWIYKAVKSGTNTVVMHYGRHGQGVPWKAVSFTIKIVDK